MKAKAKPHKRTPATSHAKKPRTIVGIDIETTSLDPAEGEIIEVAALRFDLEKQQEIERYVRLARPKTALTPEITAITGITQEDVADKPAFAKLRDELTQFVGKDLVFAHNATFDLTYLAHNGADFSQNQVWDTFKLATVAWPQAPSYNLGTLAQQLGITNSGEHRAAADVVMTWLLLQKIEEQLTVSSTAYKKIEAALKKASLKHYLSLFKHSKSKTTAQEPKKRQRTQPSKDSNVNTDDMAAIFGPKGPLAKKIPNFVVRNEQQQMAQAVEEALEENAVSLIEAGTGTGKTYAYLVPLVRRIPTTRPVVVSTHTKHLQDQLVMRDIPRLLEVLDKEYAVATLKGRRNYLCEHRLEQALQRTTLKEDEAWLLIKSTAWLDHGGNGDLEHLNSSHQASYLLRHLHADALSCRTICSNNQDSTCPYQLARRAAKKADILVVNHALLVQAMAENNLVPLTHVVVDETQHLEHAAREATRIELSEARITEIVAPFIQLARTAGKAQRQHIAAEAQTLVQEYTALLMKVGDFLESHAQADRIRLTPTVRRNAQWQKIIKATEQWQARCKFLIGLIQSQKRKGKNDLAEEALAAAQAIMKDIGGFMTGNPERIQWVEKERYPRPGTAGIQLHDVALSAKRQLQPIFENAQSVVLTSATITTGGTFEYIKKRLGIEANKELQLGSSFDYKQQMLIQIIEDSPSPGTFNYDTYIAGILEQIATTLSGRTLGLFTSHESIRNVYKTVIRMLYKANIKVLAQRLTGGRSNIINRFKQHETSILLGTASLWEGVDVPGESLSCVVIARLPFPQPDDPILEALAEAERVDMFEQLGLPQMILRLRQGIGRLIRSQTDKGVIVIVDSRFLRQEYGTTVLRSLPPATIQIRQQDQITRELRSWFGEEKLTAWKAQLTEEKNRGKK